MWRRHAPPGVAEICVLQVGVWLKVRVAKMSIPMNTAVAAAHAAPIVGKPIRVMVVDNAIVVRRQLTRWIGDEKDMLVAACVPTGREAIDHRSLQPRCGGS